MAKLSHSAASKLTSCGRSYKLHYIDRLRERDIGAALPFGSAIDQAVNTLLETKDLNQAEVTFDKAWNFAKLSSDQEVTFLPDTLRVLYRENDLDLDLVDAKLLLAKYPTGSLEDLYSIGKKARQYRSDWQKKFYNYACWLSLYTKGLTMLRSYATEVLPRIKEVISIQKEVKLEDDLGNSITGYIDAIVKWEDGNNYVVDLKTSSIQYDEDAAERSQQLILYFHSEKDLYNLYGAGFIVMSKRLQKNKVKICSKCGMDGSSARFKTCNNIIEEKRCDGSWNETIKPSSSVQFVFNKISPIAENLVMENFGKLMDKVNKKEFEANFNQCVSYFGKCTYYNYCWKGTKEGLTDLGEPNE